MADDPAPLPEPPWPLRSRLRAVAAGKVAAGGGAPDNRITPVGQDRPEVGTLFERWRSGLIAGAVTVAVVAATTLGVFMATRPTTLSVAVPAGSEDARLLAAAGRILERDGAAVRLRLVPVDGPAAASAALDGRDTDLAVVRTDVAMPAAGETVAILRRDAAIVVARGDAGLSDVSSLAGHDVVIVDAGPADAQLLDAILRHYEIPAHRVRVRKAAATEVADELAMRGAAAIFMVGPPTDPRVAGVIRAVSAAGGAPAFVAISEAEAMSLRHAAFEPVDIVRGAFGGTPPRPAEPLTTLGVSWRLMAHRSLDDSAVADLTRHLFMMRSDLARTIPAAEMMDAPDLDKGARMPVHTGAADFFQDEEQTFMERYGDWIYVAAMLIGFGGSAIAAVATRMRSRVHRHAQRIEHLLSLVARARTAAAAEELDALEAEADAVVAETLTAAADPPDAARLAALSFALDQVRHAVADRRRMIYPREPGAADIAWRGAP